MPMHQSLTFRAGLSGVLLCLLAACSSVSLDPVRPTAQTLPPVVTPQPIAPKAVAGMRFIRPASGSLIARFDGQSNRGIDIAGSPGEPIFAAADGSVVYAGSDLANFGNMIIVKHDDVFLTAYAHNAVMLVQENERVRQGQQIATMGSTGTDRVKLHFEIRRDGQAVDPLPYLEGARAQ